jgi:dGTPase
MNWENCISEKRSVSSDSKSLDRSNFQRDYDRLIFSSAFRRLQNKTQVFPLPGNAFVHNRLTHSLEVSCVGRSLGVQIGNHIAQNILKEDTTTRAIFYLYDLPSVIAAACIAHDIGNPPFGHSGEKAISTYFLQNKDRYYGDKRLIDYYNEKEWADVTNFEGNANALHILTNNYTGKMPGGLMLTYTTLASILKYPCEADAMDRNYKHRKKFGFFQQDQAAFYEVVEATNMIQDESTDFISFKRHPFVYLVEAADDICYRIIDLEDANRIGILPTEQVSEFFFDIIKEINRGENDLDMIKQKFHYIKDANERISYLRAKCINTLVMECRDLFAENAEYIIEGTWNDTLIDNIEMRCKPLQMAYKISIDKIYNHRSVIEVELAGYNVMSELLDLFLPAMLTPKKSSIQKKTLSLVPGQYINVEEDSPYINTMTLVDFIAGMTDGYATELYKNCKGIEIARHK